VSVFIERWANPPETAVASPGPATVPAGDAAVGGPRAWAMAGGWTLFPRVGPANAYPPEVLRIFDPDAPSEIIRVTDSRTANWAVVRGDQGTTPVAHAPGFAVYNAISAAGIGGLAQGVRSGNGIRMPSLTIPARWFSYTAALPNGLVGLNVPAGEAGPGAVYEAVAWGHYHTNGTVNRTFEVGIEWGLSAPLLPALAGRVTMNWATAANDVARWRCHGIVNHFAGSVAHGSMALNLAQNGTVDNTNPATQPRTFLLGSVGAGGLLDGANASVPVSVATSQRFRIWAVIGPVDNAGTLVVQGGRAWKAA
jgi:hypothetical protein